MKFTTTTEIARKWSKLFKEFDEAVILNNNKDIWLILTWDLARAVSDSWVILQIREELWESNDEETKDLVDAYKSWKDTDSISLSDFRSKYGI